MSIRMESDTPARFNRAIVFGCDGNYLPFAAFAASQIAALHPERDFDICICAMGERLTAPAGLEGLGLRFCSVETDGLFRGLNLDKRRTEAAYLRLALPEVFGSDYQRLLYLDSDVFVQAGDYSAFMSVGLGGHTIAAVRDNTQWRTTGRRPEQFRLLGMPSAPYFNSGMLLIDVAEFNDADLLNRCIAFAHAHEGRMIGHDQNLLNCVLQGDWAEAHPVWNWQYTWASRLFEALECANMVHFIGPTKPWRDANGRLPRRFRSEVERFVNKYFPEKSLEPAPPRPHEDRAFLRRMLLKHLAATGKFCDYLDRFDGEFDVIARPEAARGRSTNSRGLN